MIFDVEPSLLALVYKLNLKTADKALADLVKPYLRSGRVFAFAGLARTPFRRDVVPACRFPRRRIKAAFPVEAKCQFVLCRRAFSSQMKGITLAVHVITSFPRIGLPLRKGAEGQQE
jgi:hypothetical protein